MEYDHRAQGFTWVDCTRLWQLLTTEEQPGSPAAMEHETNLAPWQASPASGLRPRPLPQPAAGERA